MGTDRRADLAAEVKRHREKAERAQARLDALSGIPERDPFEEGGAFKCQRGRATFVWLKAGGSWYGTGRTVPQRITWPQLVDWLVDGAVSEVTLQVDADVMRLSDLEEPEPIERGQFSKLAGLFGSDPEAKTPGSVTFTRKLCSLVYGEHHSPHIWWDENAYRYCQGHPDSV